MNWHWADQLLQQLLKCAMAAGLLRALPEGCLAAAGIAVDHNPSGGSSSGTGRRPISDAERLICTSVTASAGCLFDAALRQRDATKGGGRDEEMQTHFVSQPVVAEVALQLLAVRCLLTHKQLAQWQQQQRGLMSGQQGRHMRRDVLLLLPSDLQQHLAQLLPPGVMIDVIAANTAAGRTSNDMPAGQQHWEEMRRLVSVLQLHVTIVANSQSDGSISSPALSAAVLQLSAVLLLLAAAEWQRQWCALTVQQQELLKADTAALDEAAVIEASRMRQPLAPAAALVTQSCLLLQQQTQVLWSNGQWQPQLQLLQQGGGEVLLQALTLAMHCSSVDSGLRSHADLRYFKLLQVVMSLSGEQTCVAHVTAAVSLHRAQYRFISSIGMGIGRAQRNMHARLQNLTAKDHCVLCCLSVCQHHGSSAHVYLEGFACSKMIICCVAAAAAPSASMQQHRLFCRGCQLSAVSCWDPWHICMLSGRRNCRRVTICFLR
jgi:hypothetical protein